MKKIRLSKKYSIYRGKYTKNYTKKDFLEAVKINSQVIIPSNNNSDWIEINNRAFNSVNETVKLFLSKEFDRSFNNYAEQYWVYTQFKGFNLEYMHQHLLLHPSGRSKIMTDYAFTFYINQPKKLKGNEGAIVFEDENNNRHTFLPKEKEIFIFPGDIRHTAIPTPNHDEKRVVYCGNLAFDVLQPPCFKKAMI